MELTDKEMKELLFRVTEPNDKVRVNIKQTAKGLAYFDVTARGQTREEVQEHLKEIIKIAKEQCEEINNAKQII